MINKEEIIALLENVADPEVPVLSVIDLGIVRTINIINDKTIELEITPTYSGCPATYFIATSIKLELLEYGFENITIKEIIDPAWTTDWMSDAGKQKLEDYGIAPPRYTQTEKQKVICPRCKSEHVQEISEFGSTACKSLYKCLDCLEPFDYFKCI